MTDFQQQTEQALKLENKAKEFFNGKEYNKAIESYEKALDIYLNVRDKTGIRDKINELRKQIVKLESLKNIIVETILENKENIRVKNEKYAEKLMDEAKKLASDSKNFEAIKKLEEAREIFDNIGFSFQVRRMNWEIKKLEDIESTESAESAESAEFKTKISQERMESIAENISIRKKAKEDEKKRIENEKIEAQKEIERKKTTELQEKKRQLDDIKRQKDIEMQEWLETRSRQEEQKQKTQNEQRIEAQKIKQIRAEKENLFNKASSMLDEAKITVNNREFKNAKSIYLEAVKIFEENNWPSEARMVRNEIVHVNEMEKREIKLKEKELESKQKHIIELEEKTKQLSEIIQIKEDFTEELSPEEQEKLKIIEFNIQKAEKSEKNRNFSKALKRYEFILDLYNDISGHEQDKEKIKRAVRRLKTGSV